MIFKLFNSHFNAFHQEHELCTALQNRVPYKIVNGLNENIFTKCTLIWKICRCVSLKTLTSWLEFKIKVNVDLNNVGVHIMCLWWCNYLKCENCCVWKIIFDLDGLSCGAMCWVQSHVHAPVWIWHRGENICHQSHHVAIVLLNSCCSCSECFVGFAPWDFELGFTNILPVLKNSLFKNWNIKNRLKIDKRWQEQFDVQYSVTHITYKGEEWWQFTHLFLVHIVVMIQSSKHGGMDHHIISQTCCLQMVLMYIHSRLMYMEWYKNNKWSR